MNNFRKGSHFGPNRNSQSLEFAASLKVKNIKFEITDIELNALFSKCGTVRRSTTFIEPNTNAKAGMVYYDNDDEAQAAFEKYHKKSPNYFDITMQLSSNNSNSNGNRNRGAPLIFPSNHYGNKSGQFSENIRKANGGNNNRNTMACCVCRENNAHFQCNECKAKYCSAECKNSHISMAHVERLDESNRGLNDFQNNNSQVDTRDRRGRENFKFERDRKRSQSLNPRKARVYMEQSSFEDILIPANDRQNFSAKNVCQIPVKFQTPIKPAAPSFTEKLTLTNDYVEVAVVYIESPHSFYIRSPVKDKISEYLQQHGKNEAMVKNPQVGEKVIAKFREDNLWYRGMIQKINFDGSCEVKFIDYGNVGSVISSEIRTLPDILDVNVAPIQAIHCCLANIVPNNCDSLTAFNLENWNNNTQLKAKKIFQIEDLYFVLLSSNDKDVDKVLLKFSEGENMRFINENILDFLKRKQPSAVSGMITVNISSGCFWFANNSPELINQLYNLNDIYNNCPLSVKNNFEVGSFVVARKSTTGKQWHRAYVLDVAKDGFLVQYLDFGGREKVSEVKPLPEELYFYPTLAVILQSPATDVGDDDFDATQLVTIKVAGGGDISITSGEKKSIILVTLNDDPFEYIAASVWDNIGSFMAKKKIQKSSEPCLSGGKVFCSETPYTFENRKSEVSSSRPIAEALNNLALVEEFSPKKVEIEALKSLPEVKVPSLNEVVPITPIFNIAEGVFVNIMTKENHEYSDRITEILESKRINATNRLTNLPAPSQILCGKSTDYKAWYRCSVIKVASPDNIEVQYVDYGNKEILSLDNLIEAPPTLLNYPPLAILVTLVDIDERLEKRAWEKLLSENDWQMRVTNSQSNPIQVVMSNSKSVLLKNLIEPQIVKNVSFSTPKSPERHEVQATSSPKEIRSPNSSTEPNTKLDSPKMFLYDEAEMVKLPLEKKILEVVFVSVEAPLGMFCWFGNSVRISKQVDELSTRFNKMNIEKSRPCVPVVGELCFAKFTDGGWYRAVCATPGRISCNVVFVDFGNTLEVERCDLRAMRQEFMSLPIQGIQCSIEGVPSGKIFGPEDCTLFKDLVPLMTKVEIEVVDFDSRNNHCSIRIPSIESELQKLGFIA